MAAEALSDENDAGPLKPEIKPRPRMSMVWLIPLVAAVIGGWLFYKTQAEKGPTITIQFATASGIEAGKTPIRFRDVTLGTVRSVALSEDFNHVIVTAEMDREADRSLTQSTEFWVVQPRLTASGVSGLGTLFSGAYIAMLPGTGTPQRSFVGLEEPPVLDVTRPGRRFLLKSDRIGSVSPGSGIYYRGIPVGLVLGSHLDADKAGVTFLIFIEQAYQDLIRPSTRFWNASGVDVSIGGTGVNIRTESLQSVLTGGIAFEVADKTDEQPSDDGAVFTLYRSYEAIASEQYTVKIPYLVEFDGSVRGLSEGAPVEFRGMRIGSVTGVKLVIDYAKDTATIPVLIDLEPQRFEILNMPAQFTPYSVMEEMVERGLRAQLQPANLLTGELLVALDFFPDTAPAKLDRSGKVPRIPSIPTNFEVLSTKATAILDKVAALPLDQLVNELRRTVRSADTLVSVQATKSLDQLAPLLKTLQQASEQAKLALAQADATMKSANSMIGDDSRLRYDLIRMVKELSETARSLRALASSIERQPQQVIFGKDGEGNQ